MRQPFFALMVFTALSPVTAFSALAKDIPVESEIRAATVYSDRATLTRNVKVKIPAGSHNLVFTGLPVSLFSDSLRTEGSAKADVTFGALTHKRENHSDYVVPKEKDLNAQLVALQDYNKLYNIEKHALKAGKTFLENVGKQASLRTNEDIAKIELNPDSWSSAADSISTKMLENMKSSLALDIKIRDTNEKIRKIQSELRDLRTGQKQTYSVTVPFEADKDTTLNIDLSYQLPSVGWQPIYDARLDVKTGKLNLVQYGSVWQRTGEDWKDVELTLSTAQPSRGTGLPDLHPHWVSIINNVRHMKSRGANNFSTISANISGSAAPMAVMEMAEISADTDLEDPIHRWRKIQGEKVERSKVVSIQAAQINTEGFVGEYKITGPANVKSDGTKSKLLVGGFDTQTWKQVQIKPQYGTDAYLVIKTKLKGDAPILPGQVNLFRDGAFIGKTHLPMLRPDDVEELAFGIDDNVTVKRNTVKNENSEAGMITKESVVERHYVTEIQNLHKDPVDIAVLETVPVSSDKRLRIEILKDKTTQGYETDLHDVKGVTRWIQTLKPQGQSKINLGWKAVWPKGENVSGL
ncbi:MAG: mucoidy inhibitor MuiA family protein [Alphaproteobacteria bacterium]